jgi:hypothetical protein
MSFLAATVVGGHKQLKVQSRVLIHVSAVNSVTGELHSLHNKHSASAVLASSTSSQQHGYIRSCHSDRCHTPLAGLLEQACCLCS